MGTEPVWNTLRSAFKRGRAILPWQRGSIAGFILTLPRDHGHAGGPAPYRGMGIGPPWNIGWLKSWIAGVFYIYSNVLPDNTNSIRIHAKLGFTRCPDLVSWLDPMAQE